MSRNSLLVALARGYQNLPLSFLRILETPILQKKKSFFEPSLLICLALPRSGSTLAYQLLVHSLQPLYLSNIWNTLYKTPLLGGVLSKKLCSGYCSEFYSEQGFVPGICGPSEGLRFWSYWLDQGINEARSRLSKKSKFDKKRDHLKQTLSVLTSREFPFVSGYIGHSLFVKELQEIFPHALFIRLSRDLLSTAYSILKLRQRQGGSHFSVFPQECQVFSDSNIYRQVAAQVYFLNKRIDNAYDPDRTVNISYEGLCADPQKELNQVISFCNCKGMSLELFNNVPDAFDSSNVHPDYDYDSRQLDAELRYLSSCYEDVE